MQIQGTTQVPKKQAQSTKIDQYSAKLLLLHQQQEDIFENTDYENTVKREKIHDKQ